MSRSCVFFPTIVSIISLNENIIIEVFQIHPQMISQNCL